MDEPRDEGGGVYGMPYSPPDPPKPAPESAPLHPTSEDVVAGVELAPAPIERDDQPVQLYGTDKNVDDPADANPADVANAISEGPWEAAPAPFRKRDDLPDITSESVNLRMLKDYWPADTGRHQNGSLPRAREGELVAFPPEEAIALIEAGIGEREDDDAEASEAAQKERDQARADEAKRLEDEKQARLNG